MNRSLFLSLSAGLLAIFVSSTLATLPYNPTRLISTSNGSLVYYFSPQSSSAQFTLSLLNTSNTFNASSSTETLYPDLPFLTSSSSKAYIPILEGDGGDITILAGDCGKGAEGLELWHYSPGSGSSAGMWSSLQITLTDSTLSANFLSAGFSFSPTASLSDTSVYIFGGMCPQTSSPTPSEWTLDATYSNTMLIVAPQSDPSDSSKKLPYDLSMTGSRAPPIAEAGLSITPLTPIYSNVSGNISQQQNFVLIGGHTQNAFINMSQVALFSLPEDSWSFLGINQPIVTDSSNSEVEPRSGHTAVMTSDGDKIVVFGGWVGDINTPAQPQLAILEIGQGYGGSGDWSWTVPSSNLSPFPSSEGIYGHGATMLPGGVMMIAGGFTISSSGSKIRRETSQNINSHILFFNTTSLSWVSSYTNPTSPDSPAYVKPTPHDSKPLDTSSQKAGLGVGLAFGLAAVVGIIIFLVLSQRRLRQRRAIRERELRELALGAERYQSGALVGPGMDGRGGYPEMRTASWGDRLEKRIESGPNDTFPWAPTISEDQAERLRVGRDGQDLDGMTQSERAGLLMDGPGSVRSLRRSLHSRGPGGFGASFGPYPGGAPNSVFRIDEEEEGSQVGSLQRAKTPARENPNRSSALSDPFKDPPVIELPTTIDPAAEERKRELRGWVEDWNTAAETMHMSRNPSKANSQRNANSALSNSHSNSHSGGSSSGRGSPDKSDRTGSNLSEKSMMSNFSLQRSAAGTVLSRDVSTRSATAGYALFAGAAAAMAAKVTGSQTKQASRAEYGTVNTGRGAISRAPSKRSASLNFNSTSSSQGYTDRCETFSTAHTSFGPIQPGENHSLLETRGPRTFDEKADYWATPPESPTKDQRQVYVRTGSFGSQAGRKALGILGSVKRVFTGTQNVDVRDRVAELEGRSDTTQSSPTKHYQPGMVEVGGARRTMSANAAFWRGKRGAKDWDDDEGGGNTNSASYRDSDLSGATTLGSSNTIRRKPLPGSRRTSDQYEGSDEEWDVETAIQRRVVQVMFTVPKEKLRVVNADALSLLSKSDVDFEGGENDGGIGTSSSTTHEINRMSSVREGDETETLSAHHLQMHNLASRAEQVLVVLKDDDDNDNELKSPSSPTTSPVASGGMLPPLLFQQEEQQRKQQQQQQSPKKWKGKERSKYVFND